MHILTNKRRRGPGISPYIEGDKVADERKSVMRDIERFKRVGRLPKEHDVRPSHGDQSPYWLHVAKKMAGIEPGSNSGDLVAWDPVSRTSKGAAFGAWLSTELPRLPSGPPDGFPWIVLRGEVGGGNCPGVPGVEPDGAL